jgi:hypothetical protein
MTKRTRLFLFFAVGILVAGLGTGLVASYMGFQNLVLIGSDGPAELAYVPADTRAVAYADVRQVMDSELRQRLMQFEQRTAEGADRFAQETGIDIRTDVDRVLAPMSTGDEASNQRPLVLVRGRFDNSRIESLIRQHGGQVAEHKGIRLLTHPEGDMAVGFVEPGLVAVGTSSAVRRAIDTKVSGSDVTSNGEMMRLVRDMDDGNAWAVARFDALTGSQRLPAELAKQLPAITWLAASGTINGGVQGVVRAEARDEAAAQDLRDVIQGFVALARLQAGQRAELAGLMNSFQLGGQGNSVSLGFSVPSELIDIVGAMHAGRREGRQAQPQSEPDRAPRTLPELPGLPELPEPPEPPEPPAL